MERILCFTVFIRRDIFPVAHLWTLTWVTIHLLFGVVSFRLEILLQGVQHGK